MSGKSAAAESTSERDSLGRVFWLLALGGTIAMLNYEYVWSRFALRNLATISFGAWFWRALQSRLLGLFVLSV